MNEVASGLDPWCRDFEERTRRSAREGASLERIIEGVVAPDEYRLHIARYEFAAKFVGGKSVLDAACGTGYGSHFLAQNTKAAAVQGFDVDLDAVRYATLRYQHQRLNYAVHDLCARCGQSRFGTIVSFETIEHVPDPERMLASFARSLVPGGVLLVSTPRRREGRLEDRPRNPHHLREWNREEFDELLAKYFSQREWYGQRWNLYARIGGLRIPSKLTQLAARIEGTAQAELDQRYFDVLPIEAPRPWWCAPKPELFVVVCKK